MRKNYDIVVIGTGIAGLTSAIYLKEAGLDVAVITKESDIAETSTNYAQGGIIAWKKADTPEKLAKDIIKAGCDYNFTQAVNMFTRQGPQLVQEFLVTKLKMEFSRTPEGDYDFTGEAAHSERRILHYQDHTGDQIQQSLINKIRQLQIPVHSDFTAVDLITNYHHSTDHQELYKDREVMGVYALDNKNNRVVTILADYVVLATGGIGNIYQHTSNPPAATGDGISMAYRAGADIINAEMIQFHPTCLFHKDIKRFLISESLRGEGARLLNHQGQQFMTKYTPLKELAPRDVVARAITTEMNHSGTQYMLLDIHSYYKGEIPIEERFAKIHKTCLEGDIDITRQCIPIVPAAHYFCGGIRSDLKGCSSLKNLYAIGEVSCTGLHGANRLASSSLLEGLLWAKKAAEDIIGHYRQIQPKRLAQIPDWITPAYSESFDPLLLKQDLLAIQSTMWNYVGIIRSHKGLERALSDINYFSHRILKFYKEATLTRQIIELRNAVVNASIIINAALHNKKSIGCHYLAE